MEDEITKRELSDDELDNVSGGGCEENARRMRETAVHNVGVQKRKQFSVEKTVLRLNALFVVRGTGKFKAHSQSPWLAAF